MSTLKNKIVLITGASSGIGETCAKQFAELGANLILTARRIDKIKKLAQELQDQYQIKTLPLLLDIQNKQQVAKTVQELPEEWKHIDILVNNAGLALGTDKLQDGNIEAWETMINTNLCGLLYITRAILPNMIKCNNGHIINIGSVAGHDYYAGGNVYCATKHAVKAISKTLRIDLIGTNIRVTEIDPGAVITEFSEVRWQDKERAANFYSDFTPLLAKDIADGVIYSATRPMHVNIAEMIIFPTDQASVHQISRQKQKNTSLFE